MFLKLSNQKTLLFLEESFVFYYSRFFSSFAIRSIMCTTSALPIMKYLWRSGISVFVQLSGKPFMRSHSIGVNLRSFFVLGSSIMWELLFNVLSLVSIVLEGLSSGSGKAIAPSANVYLKPVFDVRSIFFAPFKKVHFSNWSSAMK